MAFSWRGGQVPERTRCARDPFVPAAAAARPAEKLGDYDPNQAASRSRSKVRLAAKCSIDGSVRRTAGGSARNPPVTIAASPPPVSRKHAPSPANEAVGGAPASDPAIAQELDAGKLEAHLERSAAGLAQDRQAHRQRAEHLDRAGHAPAPQPLVEEQGKFERGRRTRVWGAEDTDGDATAGESGDGLPGGLNLTQVVDI